MGRLRGRLRLAAPGTTSIGKGLKDTGGSQNVMQALSGERAPETFGPPEEPQRYRLLESIGSGATAQVFRCEHRGKAFAVKRIRLAKLRRQGNFLEVEEMLHQEIAIHLSLQHPRITGLVDVLESQEEIRLVMEFLAGGSLQDVLRERGFLSESQASEVFRQVVEGLHYIHTRPVMYFVRLSMLGCASTVLGALHTAI